MIKNIVFDIGNVLAAFRYRECINELGFEGETADRIVAATAESTIWSELDRGVMDFDEIVECCVRIDPGVGDEIRYFYRHWDRMLMEYDFSADWIRQYKERGYKVYLLSNFMEERFGYIHERYRFFGLEDGMVISYREQLLKPDPRIYKVLFNRYALKPEECVFLDDSPRNIQTAVALGMKGIVVNTHEQAAQDLEKLLAVEGKLLAVEGI